MRPNFEFELRIPLAFFFGFCIGFFTAIFRYLERG